MSFLTPLYILGAAAIAAPIIFHLIRRAPKGDVPFSSLMFLSPTPPRLTRRSRLDNWLLLLLRAAALVFLALAFARPFLREAAQLDFGDVDKRRIALLIDTSASMRRGDLWPRAKAIAGQVLNDCRPTDQVAIYAFDASCRPLLSFRESATRDPAERLSIARSALDRLEPTWRGTNLGQALVDTVSAIEEMADQSEKTARMPRRVVMISDLSQGSRLDALGDFQWPSDVELDLKIVADTGSNAGLERLADPIESAPGEADGSRRVRVVNNPGSNREKFELLWSDEKEANTGKPIDVYVPPGESRVIRVPRPPASLVHASLRLRGDAQAFDNTLYFAEERRGEVSVGYIGGDRNDDPDGLLYYVQRVYLDSPQQAVSVLARKPSETLDWKSNKPPELVIVADETPQNVGRLVQYANDGGTVLFVLTAPGRTETLAGLAGVSPWTVEEAIVGRGDVMLGEIAFDHPLFASLAGAQFNDFTKIRFWKYRRIDADRLGGSHVLARFENGDAAVIEKLLGKGRLLVMASGWRRADSQLARSSKFVPLMWALLQPRNPRPVIAANQHVGDRVPLPVIADTDKGIVIHKPDGIAATVARESGVFDETDQPGVYKIDMPAGASSFAVNLDPLESKTAPLPVETIEQRGVRLASHSRQNVDRDQLRQMYNAELEGRQKIWRWLILAVIGLLIFETWLAGRTVDRPHSLRAEALST
jgi:Aerotolerance regulator N-terminal/von Willebrand factor type A domain